MDRLSAREAIAYRRILREFHMQDNGLPAMADKELCQLRGYLRNYNTAYRMNQGAQRVKAEIAVVNFLEAHPYSRGKV